MGGAVTTGNTAPVRPVKTVSSIVRHEYEIELPCTGKELDDALFWSRSDAGDAGLDVSRDETVRVRVELPEVMNEPVRLVVWFEVRTNADGVQEIA